MADHVVDYVEAKNETLYKVNDQRGERSHQIIAQLERRGCWKMTKNLTGALKLKRSHVFMQPDLPPFGHNAIAALDRCHLPGVGGF